MVDLRLLQLRCHLDGVFYKRRHHNSPQSDDKNMVGNIGDLFVKCMRQVTKSQLSHLLGVSDYYVIYR